MSASVTACRRGVKRVASEPPAATKRGRGGDSGDDHGEHDRIAPVLLELRHLLEVHSVDAGDRGGTAAIATHAEIFRMSSFWRTVTRVRLASSTLVRRSLNVSTSLLTRQEVVVHVAEVRVDWARPTEVGGGELIEGVEQWHGRLVHLEDFPLELVDALDRVARVGLGEHLVLDLADVGVETTDHGQVVVDDAVDHGVEHRPGPSASRSGRLSTWRRVSVSAGLAVTDDDRETVTDEDLDLTELDRLGDVGVERGLEDHEQRIAVDLELGSLVGVDRVLDRELVEIERAADVSNSSWLGS